MQTTEERLRDHRLALLASLDQGSSDAGSRETLGGGTSSSLCPPPRHGGRPKTAGGRLGRLERRTRQQGTRAGAAGRDRQRQSTGGRALRLLAERAGGAQRRRSVGGRAGCSR